MDNAVQFNLRPLGHVTQFVEETGHFVTYAYDDLVFINHSEIILQFMENCNDCLLLYIHKDISKSDDEKIRKLFLEKSGSFPFTLKYGGKFEILEQIKDQNIDIKFYPVSSET